ncbi:S1C family serine protease [Halobaculum gomorrense]|uniref:Serine protease, S1-C subfamily, contains C-terminal PDZ domain n=1 Tax=Halobaculum gomorrense TaxID=43928 RepID=A0A1M5UL56_9EURY|nr:trypsin-like peptidase domain-containing protein [Halobaculum gomorrense]SHH63792.1 serine protease, S1-C subfamily, contains C-terminal PDZ domain [Halobaculum gomorrense]
MPTRRDLLAGLASSGAAASAGCVRLGASEAAPRAAAGSESDGSGAGTGGRSPATETDVYRSTIQSVVGILNYGQNGPQGSGSGFVAGDGYIVTNQHVVAGATEVKLRFQGNTWRDAAIVGTDAYSDLAVLRAEDRPEAATPLSWVATDPEPPVGTSVMAIGSPYGFSGSASTGVISGVDRVLSAPNNFTVADSVQTDAALNPGNSGGPIVTYGGDVAAVAARGGGDNLGFGVSAALSKRVIPALAADGEYDHSYMGVRLVEVSPLIAEAYGIDDVGGVLIVEAVEGGPADGTLRGTDGSTTVDGVSVPTGGDVVVGVGGTDVEVQADLSNYLALETSPGDTVEFTVLRDGSERTVSFELGERPEPDA